MSKPFPTAPPLLAVGLAVGAALLGVAATYASTSLSSGLRNFVALTIGVPLVLLAFARPRVALIALIAWLPFLGLARRLILLIPGGEWAGSDPILLIAPLVCSVLVLRAVRD